MKRLTWRAPCLLVSPVTKDARRFFRRTPQTNETGRAGVLLVGFSEIARRTGLPLNLAEMGASAGLNLLFDKFHYQIETADGPLTWGPPDSALTISSQWRGVSPPPLQSDIEIAAAPVAICFPSILAKLKRARAGGLGLGRYVRTPRALLAALSIADKPHRNSCAPMPPDGWRRKS